MKQKSGPGYPKHRRFVAEYMKDQNATAAYIRAGYSPKGATVGSTNLMRKPHIIAAIEKELKKIEDDVGVKATDVVRRLWAIADADIGAFFDERGRFKNINDLDANQRKLLSSVDEDELFEGVGRERQQIGVTKKIRLWDKVRALELLARKFKLLTDKVEHTVSDDTWEQLAKSRAKIREARNG